MATLRQSIFRGPGSITFSGATFYDRDGITAELESSASDISSSVAGKIDTVKSDQIARVSFTPLVSLASAYLDVFYPAWMKSPAVGQSVFGTQDAPLCVHSTAGKRVTFFAAALTKPPDLLLSPVQTLFGRAEFTALVANGKLPSDTNGFYKVETAPYDLGDPNPEGVTGLHYSGTWGSLSIPDTLNGWTVSVELQLEPVATDSQGTIDYTLGGVNVTARCTPLGLSEEQILSALKATGPRGSSLAGDNDLVIESSGLVVSLKNAALVAGPLQWGTTALRAGEIAFSANVDSQGELFSVAMAQTSQG